MTTSADPPASPAVVPGALGRPGTDESDMVEQSSRIDTVTEPSVPSVLDPAVEAAPAPPPSAAAVQGLPAPIVPPLQHRGVFDGEAEEVGAERRYAHNTRVRRSRVRRRARRVTRVIRRIDLWSVLKLALVLYTCLYAATLAALATIWAAAYSTGLIGKLQSFLGDVGLDNFRFYGDQMFRACAAIGAVLVLAGTLITVLTVALINLISELTGGIRIVVIEEEPWPQNREGLAAAEVQPLPSDRAGGYSSVG